MPDELSLDKWEQSVPKVYRQDVLWRINVYRLALYLADMSWQDVTILSKNYGTRYIGDQLYRSIGSIGANVAEGFSRNSAKDRARFYEYALGSAREGRTWYYTSWHILSDESFQQRINTLSEIIRLLLTMIPQQRNLVSEANETYDLGVDET